MDMTHTITLRHKSVEPMHLIAKDWAREHCKSFLSCTLHGNFSDGRGNEATLFMDYHFNNEADAFWFRMRWE